MNITIPQYFALFDAVQDRIDTLLITESGAAIMLNYRLVKARGLHKQGYVRAAYAVLMGATQ